MADGPISDGELEHRYGFMPPALGLVIDGRPVPAPAPNELSLIMDKLDEVRDFVLQRTDVKHHLEDEREQVTHVLDQYGAPPCEGLPARVEVFAIRSKVRCDEAERRVADLEGLLEVARNERESYMRHHTVACETIAKMHAAAFNGVARDPIAGTVEDIANLRAAYDLALKNLGETNAENERLRGIVNAAKLHDEVSAAGVRTLKLEPWLVEQLTLAIEATVIDTHSRKVAAAPAAAIEHRVLRREVEGWSKLLSFLDRGQGDAIEVVARKP